MDLAQLVGDVGTFAAPVAAQVGGQALQGGTAAAVTKYITDVFKGAWGGSVDHHPPEAAVLGFAAVAGILVMLLIGLASGIDLLQLPQLADTVLRGIRDGAGGAIALTAGHNAVRPQPPPTPPVNFQVNSMPRSCPSCGASLSPATPATQPLTSIAPPASSAGSGSPRGFNPFGPKG